MPAAVTVVLPTRDRRSLLERSLGSALDQTGVELDVSSWTTDRATTLQPGSRASTILA